MLSALRHSLSLRPTQFPDLMAPIPIIPLPLSGLTTSDIDLRLYRSGAPSPSEAAVVVLQGTSNPLDYSLLNLQEANGALMAVTGISEGQGFAYEWGAVGSPAFVVLPLRTPGETAESLALRIYKNGTEVDGIVWTLTEVGDPGSPDVLVSGWPIELDGAAWVLVWEFGGAINPRNWSAASAVALPSAVDPLIDYPALRDGLVPDIMARAASGRLSTMRRSVSVVVGRGESEATVIVPTDYPVYAIAEKIHQIDDGSGGKMTTELIHVTASGLPEDVAHRPGVDWDFIDPLGVKGRMVASKPTRPDMVTAVLYSLEVGR